MSNSKTIKTGVIGTGYLGKFHLQQLQTISEVELVGFFDSNSSKRLKCVFKGCESTSVREPAFLR